MVDTVVWVALIVLHGLAWIALLGAVFHRHRRRRHTAKHRPHHEPDAPATARATTGQSAAMARDTKTRP